VGVVPDRLERVTLRTESGGSTEDAKSDEATKTTGKPRFFTVPVLALIGLSFALGTSEFIMVGVLPNIAHDLRVPLTTVGNLVSIFAGVYAVCTPFGAALSARFQRFRIYMVLIGIFLVGNILCALALNYAMLLMARVVIAVVSGTLVAISMTFAPDVTLPQYRTRFVSWVFSGFSIASIVGVPIGTAIAGSLGWRAAFHAIDAMIVALVVVMAIKLPHHSSQPQMRVGFFSQFLLFFDPRILAGLACVLCASAASYVFYTYLTPIVTDFGHVPATFVGIALIVFGIACLASNLTSGHLASRGGGKGTEPLARCLPIFLVQAVCLASLVGVFRVPPLTLIMLVVLGFLMYLMNSPSQILFLDVAASSHPGAMNLASSLNSMSFNIGIALGAATGGLVTDGLGMWWLGPFGALFALASAGVCVFLGRYGMHGRGVRRSESSRS
jgi:predicted MFS family arabinose efflux permease